MARDFKVLGPTECPRCGAKAKMKAKHQHEGSDALGIFIQCDKCKLEAIVGITSKQEMKRQDRHTLLLKKYQDAETPLQRGRIMKEINRMESEQEDWYSAISNS